MHLQLYRRNAALTPSPVAAPCRRDRFTAPVADSDSDIFNCVQPENP